MSALKSLAFWLKNIHKAIVNFQGKVQSDWNQSDDAEPDYIKNKPNVLSYLSVSYDELTDDVDNTKNISPERKEQFKKSPGLNYNGAIFLRATPTKEMCEELSSVISEGYPQLFQEMYFDAIFMNNASYTDNGTFFAMIYALVSEGTATYLLELDCQ